MFWEKWGTFSTAPGELYNPYGIAIYSPQEIYIVECENARVSQARLRAGLRRVRELVEGEGARPIDPPREKGTPYLATRTTRRTTDSPAASAFTK